MKKILKRMVLVIVSLLGLLTLSVVAFVNFSPQFGATPTGERLKRMQASPNYKDGTFQNLVPTSIDMSMGQMISATWKMLTGVPGAEPVDTFQTVPLDVKRFEGDGGPEHVAVSWFGHSSLLIRIQGKTLLTDPVFGERASFASFSGPKRFPYDHYMNVDELPHVDAVVMSHDHYDHLDYETFTKLKGKVSRFFVPLGVGVHLEKWGIAPEQITELDWHESAKLGNLTLICAPARHFSGRGLTNRNGTLWASWVLQGTQKKVYYGGDTGYYPGLKTVGEQYGPFDLAMLECGAYNEAWIDIHMLPEQTAQAQLDVKANVLLPIHWAKFNLALHTWQDPIERLVKKSAELGTTITTPRIGEVVVLDAPLPAEHWWERYH
ncbi:MBL fold metallo-hydrolase [Larkinella sp. VNQ87]|uniref:MBL fold metallo-hydrolase n=1 Tax=Larkinella sp. VNQ87 TaxID=3400921 RepID=UPI003C06DE3E